MPRSTDCPSKARTKNYTGKLVKCLCFLSGFWVLQAWAMPDDIIFQKARDAYTAKNQAQLTQYINTLKNNDYLLTPYAEYWSLLLRLDEADDSEIMRFIERYQTFAFADRLRAEWLKKLAKAQNWPLYFAQYVQYQGDDVAVKCDNLYGRLKQGEAINAKEINALWLTSNDQPSNCDTLFSALMQSGNIETPLIWDRLRLALQDGKPNLAKSIAMQLGSVDQANLVLIDRAMRNPKLFLDKRMAAFKSRYGSEVNLFALDRLARSNVDQALDAFSSIQGEFDPAARAFAWQRLGLYAARDFNASANPNARDYYTKGQQAAVVSEALQATPLYKDMRAWQVRAALRVQDWPVVLQAIAFMSPKQAEEGAWRYWKARALNEIALGNTQTKSLEAQEIFSQLAKERHYYAWLALDELPPSVSNVLDDAPASSEADIQALANSPAFRRAVALLRVEMRWEAKTEWLNAISNFEDRQLLAAASYANRLQWYDIAIMTADSTKNMHDFNLRYPTPYRNMMKSAANEQGLDEAWVYGLTRQESRFMDYAKSGVGASGLMQLMPATAKWAAKKKGIFGYSNLMIHDLKTNIELGTFYMRHTLDLMDGQSVLATAAYNAGPARAKRWMAAQPIEGAIYIETIPFTETRNYVQKVMANAHLYAPRLGTKIQTLKARIGVIPASSNVGDVTQ